MGWGSRVGWVLVGMGYTVVVCALVGLVMACVVVLYP